MNFEPENIEGKTGTSKEWIGTAWIPSKVEWPGDGSKARGLRRNREGHGCLTDRFEKRIEYELSVEGCVSGQVRGRMY